MLIGTPTEHHVSRCYWELTQHGAPAMGAKRPWPYRPASEEALLALAAEMSRYDPRLLGILVQWCLSRWPHWHPQRIRAAMRDIEYPQALGVICAFAMQADPNDELRYFCAHVMAGVEPVRPQYFFHHLYDPAGVLAQRAAEESLTEYKRWGFLARERPILDRPEKASVGTFDPTARRNILRRLLDERTTITLREYLAAVQHRISRQQALHDFRSIEGLHRRGRGRGAKWFTTTPVAGTR